MDRNKASDFPPEVLELFGEAAAKLARTRTLAFFELHLRG